MNLSEPAAFLTSRRARVRPGDAGLRAGPRRRVPGPRREEVARLAGLSAGYCTELERGPGAGPSRADAGRAGPRAAAEQGRARSPVPSGGPPYTPAAHVEPGPLSLLDRLTTTPAIIITALHETLAQNALPTALGRSSS